MNKTIKKNKSLLKLLLAVLTISGCSIKNKITKTKKAQTQQKNKKTKQSTRVSKEKHTITVWIHGTRLMHGFLHRKVASIKNFFYRELGLKEAQAYSKDYNLRKIAVILCEKQKKRFNFDNFYFFGWSGNLDHNKRKEAAKKLNTAVKKLIAKYKTKHGVTPKIRLITHSHGGNVALCLSEINKTKKRKISIDELVLLACPVQKKTEHMLKDNIFKKVYSLYSSIDLLQVVDPQGLTIKPSYVLTRPFFSQRTFTTHKKLVQTKLKINGRGILHVEFLLPKFVTLLPNILEELDAWKQNSTKHNRLNLLKITTKSKTIFRRKLLRA